MEKSYKDNRYRGGYFIRSSVPKTAFYHENYFITICRFLPRSEQNKGWLAISASHKTMTHSGYMHTKPFVYGQDCSCRAPFRDCVTQTVLGVDLASIMPFYNTYSSHFMYYKYLVFLSTFNVLPSSIPLLFFSVLFRFFHPLSTRPILFCPYHLACLFHCILC